MVFPSGISIDGRAAASGRADQIRGGQSSRPVVTQNCSAGVSTKVGGRVSCLSGRPSSIAEASGRKHGTRPVVCTGRSCNCGGACCCHGSVIRLAIVMVGCLSGLFSRVGTNSRNATAAIS